MTITLTLLQADILRALILNAGDDPRLTKRQQARADALFASLFREG